MTSHTASVLPWRQACRPAGESRKSMNPNSDRRRPSSTRRALASLAVHPWRFAMRLRRFPLAAGRRMLMTIEGADFMEVPRCNYCKYCSRIAERNLSRDVVIEQRHYGGSKGENALLRGLGSFPGKHRSDKAH